MKLHYYNKGTETRANDAAPKPRDAMPSSLFGARVLTPCIHLVDYRLIAMDMTVHVFQIIIMLWLVCHAHCLSRTTTRRSLGFHMSTTSTSSFPKVVVKRNRQSKSFREGNPLVYTKTIAYTESSKHESLPMACLVQVQVPTEPQTKHSSKQNDYPHYKEKQPHATQSIGWGVYNPFSMYRVRILCHSIGMNLSLREKLENAPNEEEALSIIIMTQLQAAIQVRRALGFMNPQQNESLLCTDTFRLVNGEGDSLSGLAVDVIGGNVAVVMSSAAWCQVHKDTILKCLEHVLKGNNLDYDIVWKTTPSRLQQDGMDVIEEDNGEPQDADKKVLATELGIRYATFPYSQGQKTGYYCDQRENRGYLAQYCNDARVLDLCCYHGGFALSAAIHGKASHVTGVDSSQQAIDVCQMNAILNNCTDKVTFINSVD